MLAAPPENGCRRYLARTQGEWSTFPSSPRDQSQPADFITQGDSLESKQVPVSFRSHLARKPSPLQGWRDLAPAAAELEGTHDQCPRSWGGLDLSDELVCSRRTREASAQGSPVQWHPQCHPWDSWSRLPWPRGSVQEGALSISPTGSYPRDQRGFGAPQSYKIKYMEMLVKHCIGGSQIHTQKIDSS